MCMCGNFLWLQPNLCLNAEIDMQQDIKKAKIVLHAAIVLQH